MGFDAFGLPAENYAIKTGTHPAITTKKNIATYMTQMESLGFSYDWDRMVDTTDPHYFQWTQWIFTRLFERWLAYEQDLPINYCPSCKTGLANEEVLSDNTCERCGMKVERRAIRQWVLKITAYADRLLEDLDSLDWPQGIKEMQRNWIGKSEGCEFTLRKAMTKKWRLPLSVNGGVHNGLAQPSLGGIVYEDLIKVNKKIYFSGIIEWQLLTEEKKKISFRSENILHHFRWKSKKEFIKRAQLLGTVFSVIDRLSFDDSNFGYFLYKKLVIKVILWQQENGNYFVKSYYVAGKLTEEYRVLKENITFSKANQEDYEKILQIRKETWFHTIDFAQDQFFVAKKWDEIAGFIRTQKIDEKNSELWALFVVEKFRKEKLGYRLIDSVIEHTEAETFFIDCKLELREYYEKYGFGYCDTPTDFQMKKLRKVWDFYGKNSTDDEIKEKTIFMKITKKKTPSISVYTTRIDTVYGMTYAVLAPDHPQVYEFITDDEREQCEQYIEDAKRRSDQERTNEGREKTWVFTGSYVENPFNGEAVPLWIADYVLGNYGTWAVMAVPAHDERDWAFAKKYGLQIRQVIAQEINFTGVNAVRAGVETLQRETVDILLENDNWEFLLLRDKDTGNYHFIWWWRENHEDEIDAVKRELTEETGYTDFEIVWFILGSYLVGYGYRYTKWKNQRALWWIFHVKLKTDKRIASEFESGKHWMSWFSKEEVWHKLWWDSHKLFWKTFKYAYQGFLDDWILCNSQEYTWLSSGEARKVLTEKAEKEWFGKKKVNYKLRDWLFSRQRYWGEPIPLIHISHEDYAKLPRVSDKSEATEPDRAYIYDKKGTSKRCRDCTCTGGCTKLIINGKTFSRLYDGLYSKIIIDPRLPLTLPEVERYEPAWDGNSPLFSVKEWVDVKLAENLSGKRETNTMPQWWGSCWYYLRYMDPENGGALASREALEYWGMVDEYVWGAEHAVLHLLYARFWHKFLFDIGVVPTKEPFQKLTNVGMISAYAYERKNGWLVAVDLVEEREGKFYEKSTGEEVKQIIAKMSKSLKNVVNPNEIVREHGADTLRLYEMSMSAFTDSAPWNPEAIIGVRRFLDKVYASFTEGKTHAKDDMKAMKLLHKTVKKVGEDIVAYKFNTAISALMILLNEWVPHDEEFAHEWKEKFLILLHPFAPHIAEELYSLLPKMDQWEQDEESRKDKKFLSPIERDTSSEKNVWSIYHASWPTYDEFMLAEDEITIAVQINGKLRGTFQFLNGVAQEEVSEIVLSHPNIAKWLEGKEILKEIFIPNKMLSIVVR